MRVPAEALQPAFAPAIVAQPGVDLAGRPALNVQAFPGAVTLLDFFATSGRIELTVANEREVTQVPDAVLLDLARLRWRLAVAMLQTRPTAKPEEPPNRLSLVNGGGDS